MPYSQPLQTEPMRRAAPAIQLGFDPPLDAGMRRHALDERHRVNLRWLSATVLTGVIGSALMGLAIFTALETQSGITDGPELAAPLTAAAPRTDKQVAAARKGDKLIRAVDLMSAKQAFKTPTTMRLGDKEVIKLRAFARVNGPLLLAATAFHDEVPAFNPVKLMSEGAVERSGEAGGNAAAADESADVSLLSRDLSSYEGGLSLTSLGEDEAKRQAAESLAQSRRTNNSALFVAPQTMLARSMRPPPEIASLGYASIINTPFSGIEVRMVPENVTALPKTTLAPSTPTADEKVVTIRRGETAEIALKNAGADIGQARAAVQSLLRSLKAEIAEGQRMKLLFGSLAAADAPPGPPALVRVMLYDAETLLAIAAANDKGAFVPVALPTSETPATVAEEEDENTERDGLSLFNSLYETALKNDVPKPVIEELVRVFSYDIDFQQRVSGGDAFDILYSEDDDADIAKGQVLFAAINIGSETKRFYRFVTPDDGTIDFYDENGRSAKKFLIRKPIADGQLRSGFGYRRHPVLGYSKMHTGVDWANRVGTPILAAGNGTVIKAEWDSGYGRRTEIQHVNGYVTTYNHQSSFAKGIVPGARVRQGQVIGYVGTSGLSTGPHLHYEVIVNDHFVDPMRIKLPRGRELDGRILAEFKRERDRIEGLLKKAPNQLRVAQQ